MMSEIELSEHGKKAKRYYDAHLWNAQMLRNLVKKGWITQAEYDYIVGTDE